MKKIIALIAALSMTLSMASCGSGDNGDAQSNTNETQSEVSSQAQQTVTDAEESVVSAVQSEESAGESLPEDTQSADETPDDGEVKVTEDRMNVFYNAPEYKPTKEELLPIIQRAAEHYEAARKGDWKAYLDTINYDGLLNAPSFRAIAEFDEEQTDNMPRGLDMAVFYVFYTISCNYAEEKYGDEYKDGTLAEFLDSVTRAWDEITDEEAEKMVKYGFGAYRYFTEFESLVTEMDSDFERDTDADPIGSDAVYDIWVEECDRIGDDMYLSLNIQIYSNEQIYDLPLVCAWYANGEYGLISQTLRYYETPYPGMTGAEIMAALEAGDPGIDPYAEEEESEADTEESEADTEDVDAEDEE